MKRLPKIRSGLARLRMFRSTVRLGMMGSTVLSIILWAMAVAFLLDYWINMGRVERTIVLLGVLGVSIWAIVRFLAPALKVYESDTALAVMVDNMHGMHSDLVGAMQFADEDRSQYGSEQLREAVVENTLKTAGNLNFLEGFSRKDLRNRLLILGVTLLVCLTPALVYANYAGAFLKRIVLFEASYPTRVHIEIVSPLPGAPQAEGEPVNFKVRATHVSGLEHLPEKGTVRISAVNSGHETAVDLVKLKGEGDDKHAVYAGQLERVMDDLACTVAIGDAVSDVRYIKLIPRPRVKLKMERFQPKYVGASVPPESKNPHQAVVVEGARVVPVVTCENKKLREGKIRFEKDKDQDDSGEDKYDTFDMTLRDGKLVFDAKDSPLTSILKMTRFEIDVTDTNGQKPESPIKGVVHIAADLPPSAAVAGFSRYIVLGAAPELRYKAKDDYALEKLALRLAIIDLDGVQTELEPLPLPKPLTPEGERAVSYKGAYTLNMGKLTEMLKAAKLRDLRKSETQPKDIKPPTVKIRKGYQISALIEATDFRGELPGKSRRSDKWFFEITDDAGVLEAMDRLTEEMDKKLDEILRAQREAGK